MPRLCLSCVPKLVIISVFLFNISCGSSDQQHNSLTDIDQKANPLFVYMGGNLSCRRDQEGTPHSPFANSAFEKYQILLKKLSSEFGIQTKTIVTCYEETARIYMSTTWEPSQINGGDQSELLALIKKNSNKNTPVFLIGHSYGGWLAMSNLLQLAESRNIKALFTIDPISRKKCTPRKPLGCFGAPQDFSSEEKEFMNEVTHNWMNVYQTKTWYLHSSEISESDYNEKIHTGHMSIDSHGRTWELVDQLLYMSL